MKFKEVEILSNEEIQNGIYKMVVKEEENIKAGQFYMLKCKNKLLQRPISICEKEGENLIFLYAVVGEGTRDFSIMKKGEKITLVKRIFLLGISPNSESLSFCFCSSRT